MFLVATFLGLELITKVPQMLHTPLMSGANAISGITILAALEAARGSNLTLALLTAFLAIFFATVNVVGGFAVTDRMLGMFKKK
ncbi:MAG: NAD(P) transhydrogenase subunit alpha [Planctomycetota bacterium]